MATAQQSLDGAPKPMTPAQIAFALWAHCMRHRDFKGAREALRGAK